MYKAQLLLHLNYKNATIISSQFSFIFTLYKTKMFAILISNIKFISMCFYIHLHKRRILPIFQGSRASSRSKYSNFVPNSNLHQVRPQNLSRYNKTSSAQSSGSNFKNNFYGDYSVNIGSG